MTIMTTGNKIVPIVDYIARPDWTGRPDWQFDKSVANTGLKVSLGIRSKPWTVKKKNCIEDWPFLFMQKEPCTKTNKKISIRTTYFGHSFFIIYIFVLFIILDPTGWPAILATPLFPYVPEWRKTTESWTGPLKWQRTKLATLKKWQSPELAPPKL